MASVNSGKCVTCEARAPHDTARLYMENRGDPTFCAKCWPKRAKHKGTPLEETLQTERKKGRGKPPKRMVPPKPSTPDPPPEPEPKPDPTPDPEPTPTPPPQEQEEPVTPKKEQPSKETLEMAMKEHPTDALLAKYFNVSSATIWKWKKHHGLVKAPRKPTPRKKPAAKKTPKPKEEDPLKISRRVEIKSQVNNLNITVRHSHPKDQPEPEEHLEVVFDAADGEAKVICEMYPGVWDRVAEMIRRLRKEEQDG